MSPPPPIHKATKKLIFFYLIVVIAAVVGPANNPGSFLGIGANEVDLRVVEYLVVLVGRQLVHVQLHHLSKPQQRVIKPVCCGSGSVSFLEADPDPRQSEMPDPDHF